MDVIELLWGPNFELQLSTFYALIYKQLWFRNFTIIQPSGVNIYHSQGHQGFFSVNIYGGEWY